jgi:hypothetical protein
MNEKKIPSNDDSRFDRLVDGELSEVERRELLAGLDNEPGGWRRCALAFLESQCWKESFRSMQKTECKTPPVSQPSVVAAGSARSARLARLRTAMAMAACFMTALLIGSLLPRGRFSPITGPVDTTNQIAAVTPGAPGSGGMAPSQSGKSESIPSRRSEGLAGSGSVGGRAGESVPGSSRGASQQGPWQMVTLQTPADERGEPAAMQLPARERKNVDEAWLKSVPSAIPDEVLQALNRTGHQVSQHRELVPVPMQDGRRLVVPVDQVDMHYIGNGPY